MVLAKVGLRLSDEKAHVTHIDTGFDFLGVSIRRCRNRKTPEKVYVYTYPSKTSLKAAMAKVKTWTSMRTVNLPLKVLLIRVNQVLRGWGSHHRHGAAKETLSYLGWCAYRRITHWLRKKHQKTSWKDLSRTAFLPDLRRNADRQVRGQDRSRNLSGHRPPAPDPKLTMVSIGPAACDRRSLYLGGQEVEAKAASLAPGRCSSSFNRFSCRYSRCTSCSPQVGRIFRRSPAHTRRSRCQGGVRSK